MSPPLVALLALAALLGLLLLAVPGQGGGWKRLRVMIHLLSTIGFAAVGSNLALHGDVWAGIGILAVGFLWIGGFWVVSIRRRLLRGARPHRLSTDRGTSGLAPSTEKIEEGAGGEPSADDFVPAEELDPQEREILRRLLAMGELRVSEIATPRERIVHADCSGGTAEVLGMMHRSRHPRIPVVDGSVDRIVGILHAKDLAPFVLEEKKSPALKGLMRRPLFVSHDRTVASLLELFRSQRGHMAIVVDAYSRTIGLITRSDLFRHLSGGGEGRADG
jgi:CBS domain containing-hemolysin-like protein